MSGDNKKWEKLLPPIYQRFVSKLDFNDYANDELIYNIVSIIEDLKELKTWKWFSSKEESDGFVVIVTGEFLPRLTWFIHAQDIALSKLTIKADVHDTTYNLKVYKDVTLYKKFDL